MLKLIHDLVMLSSKEEQICEFRERTGACAHGTALALKSAGLLEKQGPLTFAEIAKVGMIAAILFPKFGEVLLGEHTEKIVQKDKARRAYLHRVAKRKTRIIPEFEHAMYYYLLKGMPVWYAIDHIVKVKRIVNSMELSNLIDCSIELECGRERKERVLRELVGEIIGDANHNPIVGFIRNLIYNRVSCEGQQLLEKELKELPFAALQKVISLSSRQGYYGPSEALSLTINGTCLNRGEYTRQASLLDLNSLALQEKDRRIGFKPATICLGDLM